MIRLTIPTIEEDDLLAVREVLSSGFLVQGQQVKKFEQIVADYVGTECAVAVSSGTAALHLSLLALDMQPGDLVVVTAYSFIATANVIELCGAQPIFVDIQPDTFNMDPNCLDGVLRKLARDNEKRRRIKAILPVHTFGQLADMPAILEIAKHYEVPVIEDAACALGATLKGRQAGTWGLTGCFSFHPRKAITTGEGGIITTDNAELARKLRMLRNHGIDPDTQFTDFLMPGFNYRMTDFQAALGITQMAKLDRIIEDRRRSAKHYEKLLNGSQVQSPVSSTGSLPVYQSYVVLFPDEVSSHRDEIIALLYDNNLETSIGTWHIPMTRYYRSRYGFLESDFPNTDNIFKRALTLPLFEKIGPIKQAEVVRLILSAITKWC
jgi:dTDP-4-amino-4,6-dideoxygalactose transaminase